MGDLLIISHYKVRYLDFLKRELFWKVLIWRIGVSIPLTILINFMFYHSIATVLVLTVVSNIVGYVAQYIFELNWRSLWRVLNGKHTKD